MEMKVFCAYIGFSLEICRVEFLPSLFISGTTHDFRRFVVCMKILSPYGFLYVLGDSLFLLIANSNAVIL